MGYCNSDPQPPPVADPAVVANAQGAANVNTAASQAALNNVNQVTPYGNLTYTQSGTQNIGGNDVPQYTATTTLSPAEQKALDSQQQLTQSLYGFANNQTGRIADNLSQPLSFGGLPNMAKGLSDIPSVPTGINTGSLPSLISGIDKSQLTHVPTGLNGAGLPQQVSGLNFGALPRMPGSPQQTDNQVTNAMYSQATSRLDPQWEQASQLQADRLSQQGIPVGSQAWNTAMTQFNQSKNDAYNSALNSAITSGAQQGSTDYGLSLQGVNTGVGVQTANAGLANQAGQFGLASQGENAAIANQSFQNGLQEQTANAGLANQAYQTGLQGQTANAAVANQAAQQSVSQQAESAALAQAARQQGINEQTYLYNQPLNEASALLSGGQLQGPSFINTPQTNIAPTNVLGAYQNAQQGNQYNYEQQMQNNSSALGGLFGLAGAGLSAGLSGGLGGSSSSLLGKLFSSSRTFKIDNEPIDPEETLEKVRRLPVEKWRYKPGISDEGEHIGPYAEDFAREFGGDGRMIDFITLVGALTASVQAIADRLGTIETRLSGLESGTMVPHAA